MSSAHYMPIIRDLKAELADAKDYAARAAVANVDRARLPLTQREWVERFERAEAELAQARTALGDDAAGRSFAELLTVAADLLDGCGGGPVADCLRLKADDVEAALSAARPAPCPECGRDLHGYRGPCCRYCDGTAE